MFFDKRIPLVLPCYFISICVGRDVVMACDNCYHCCFLSIGAMNEITDHIMTSSPRLAFFSRQTPYSGLLLDTISLTSPQGHPHNMDSTLSNSQVRINHAQSMQLTDRIIIGDTSKSNTNPPHNLNPTWISPTLHTKLPRCPRPTTNPTNPLARPAPGPQPYNRNTTTKAQ
jgi:hypothetical protein